MTDNTTLMVKKRDGILEPYNRAKIADSIYRSAQTVGGTNYDTAQAIANKVEELVLQKASNNVVTVDDIQNLVERVLIKGKHARTAKEYILFRAERDRVRDSNSHLVTTIRNLTVEDSSTMDLKRENANVDGDSTMGIMLRYGSEASKRFVHLELLRPEHSKAHLNGLIHIHDLDFYPLTLNCVQIDLAKLFKDGFNTGHGMLREPSSIQSACILAATAIQSSQNDFFGGQSIAKFDYDMATYVAKTYVAEIARMLDYGDALPREAINTFKEQCKEYIKQHGTIINDDGIWFITNTLQSLSDRKFDKQYLSYLYDKALKYTCKATYQGCEAFIHNINTLHCRAGAQVPFSSINYGTDTSTEGRILIQSILYALDAGLGNNETPVFPVHVFKVKDGISGNPGDPNYDLFQLACKVSSHRLFPNFVFLDAPFNLKYYVPGRPETEAATMGCRTRVVGNIHNPDKEIFTGRGNLSFTSINLPRLAILANHDIDKFFASLDETIDLVFDQLLDRFEVQAKRKCKNMPFSMGQHIYLDSESLRPEDEIREVIKHGTLTIGFIGLAECLIALIGKHHGESEEAQELGLKIISHMRNRCDNKTLETKLNFSLIGSPAEGLSGRFLRIDRKEFGIIPGVTDREYYTNSNHVPVYYNTTISHKIDIEAPYHALENGGHISYVEVDGDISENPEAFADIINYMKQAGIGYGSLNHPAADFDPICGYSGPIGDVCPRCGRKDGEPVSPEMMEKIKNFVYKPDDEIVYKRMKGVK